MSLKAGLDSELIIYCHKHSFRSAADLWKFVLNKPMLTISLRCKPKKTETCTSPCELVTFLGNVN